MPPESLLTPRGVPLDSQLRALVAKGAMPPLVLEVTDVRAAYEAMHARGVEFTLEFTDALILRRVVARPG